MHFVAHLYNALMASIEPELMTGMVGRLATMYANETSEEKSDRMQRYARALALCNERFAALVAQWKGDVHAEVLTRSNASDAGALRDLDSAMGNA